MYCCGLLFVVLSMVPAWCSWVGPWVGFPSPGLVYVVGLSVFLLSRAPCFSLGLLLLLLVFGVIVACVSIGLVMVLAPFFIVLSRFSAFAICLDLSSLCLLIWLVFHCVALFFIVLAIQEQ